MSHEAEGAKGFLYRLLAKKDTATSQTSPIDRTIITRPELRDSSRTQRLVRIADLLAEKVGAYETAGYALNTQDIPRYSKDLAYYLAQAFIPSQRERVPYFYDSNDVIRASQVTSELTSSFNPEELPLEGVVDAIAFREYQRALLLAAKHTYTTVCQDAENQKKLTAFFSTIYFQMNESYTEKNLNKGKLSVGFKPNRPEETAIVKAQRDEIGRKRAAYSETLIESDVYRFTHPESHD